MEWKNVPYDVDDIGVYLMESITKGLYRNPLHVIREYIQNELDTDPRPEWIKITLQGRQLVVAGDGMGMNREDLFVAKRVGRSDKNPMTQRGFRGIGIWSGVSVCKKIVISTKRKGAKEALLLSINGDGIRREIESRSNKPLVTVLSENVGYGEKALPERNWIDKGTAVQLDQVLSEYKDTLLDDDCVRKYISLTAPVDFDPHFKYRAEINEYLEKKVPGYVNFEVKFNGQQIYRTPSADVEYSKPTFHPIKDKKGQVLAYSWVCIHSKNEEIPKKEPRRLVFKHMGMTVGDRNSIRKFYRTRPGLANWVTGEIHVVDKHLVPNTERDYFEANPVLSAFEKEIFNLIDELGIECDLLSKMSKSKERLAEATEIRKTRLKFESDKEMTEEITRIENLVKNLATDLKAATPPKPGKRRPRVWLPASMHKRTDRAIKNLEARRKKILKQMTVKEKKGEKEPEKPTEEVEEEPQEEEETEEETGKGVVDVVQEFQSKIDGVCKRAQIDESQKLFLESMLRVIFSKGFLSVEKFEDFIESLELELIKQ